MKKSACLTNAHRLLSPRIVYLITTIDSSTHVSNAATVSYLIPVSDDPARLAFAITKNTKTHSNLSKTGDFVVNIPDKSLLSAVQICGGNYPDNVDPAKVDKLTLAGLTEMTSLVVKAPRIMECYAHIECKVKEILSVGDHDLVLGDIMAASYEENAFDDKLLLSVLTKPIMQLTGSYFTYPE